MINVRNVGKEYQPGRWGVRGTTFAVQKGEFVLLTGASGAGKTTLMKLLSFEETPSTGEIMLEGYSSQRIRRRDLPHLRRRIGLVFQDFRLLRDRSVRENVGFVLKATGSRKRGVHRRVLQALAAVGLAGKADSKPNELSGGEQQRVAIARAIINDPFVVLADEPTGNLDGDTKREIFRLLKKISAGGTAVLVATHDISVATEFWARTLTLDRGVLVRDEAPLVAPGATALPRPAPGAPRPPYTGIRG